MTAFEQLKQIIESRRTVKAAAMNGQKIPDEHIRELLALADWAPTHGNTEPWYFYVYSGDAFKQFGHTHAELYYKDTPDDKRDPAKYDKLLHAVDKPSHLIIAAMKKGNNPKITALEEICAVAASIQNLLLGAEALGISCIWNSGGMTHRVALKQYLGLGKEDHVLGLLYLGYTDGPKKEGRRIVPIADKVKWM